MTESEEFVFNNGYCARVKEFRVGTGMSAEAMANVLAVPADRYRKYETRSPMPLYLVAKFCLIIGCDLEHLILGKPRDKTKQILLARKPAFDETDIQSRVEALSPEGQRVAIEVSETAASRLGKSSKKGTQGS